MTIELEPIGVARTPYTDWAPHQPLEREAKDDAAFRIVLDTELAAGTYRLERFSHMIVLAYLDRSKKPTSYRVQPPWAKGQEVGLWASRSPNRPNPIGLSVVKILRIEENEIIISPVDFFDGTPILDLKPYVATLDARTDANDGWIEDLDGHEHLLEHVRGVPHSHDHDHKHVHKHEHKHDHEHEHKHDHEHEHDHDHDHDHDH